MERKECSICTEVKKIDEFYSQKRNSKDKGEWVYYNPECKECTIERSKKHQRDNLDQRKVYDRLLYRQKEDYYKNKARKWDSENKERQQENFKNWQRENKDKLKEYKHRRDFHKSHDITKDELKLIYDYSDSSCMYCGITEEDSLERYNQKLHKDHAINNGSDGIDNCILACKSCNSSKHSKDWEEWYTESGHFTKDRYDVIVQWLNLWN